MPKLWEDTIDAHRHAVRNATLDAAAELVAESGPGSITMSAIAERTGIGRATLYKYFSDAGQVLGAWHERQVEAHLRQLTEVADRAGSPSARLEAVLEAYARLSRQHGSPELVANLHRGEHLSRAEQKLRAFLGELIARGAETGELRRDVPPDELASYCVHALAAADERTSQAAVGRLVAVTVAGLRP